MVFSLIFKVGKKNYIVTTMQTYKEMLPGIRDGSLTKHIKECNSQSSTYYGIMVAIPERADVTDEFGNPTPLSYEKEWEFKIIFPCRVGPRKRSMTEMLFYMVRSGH